MASSLSEVERAGSKRASGFSVALIPAFGIAFNYSVQLALNIVEILSPETLSLGVWSIAGILVATVLVLTGSISLFLVARRRKKDIPAYIMTGACFAGTLTILAGALRNFLEEFQ